MWLAQGIPEGKKKQKQRWELCIVSQRFVQKNEKRTKWEERSLTISQKKLKGGKNKGQGVKGGERRSKDAGCVGFWTIYARRGTIGELSPAATTKSNKGITSRSSAPINWRAQKLFVISSTAK